MENFISNKRLDNGTKVYDENTGEIFVVLHSKFIWQDGLQFLTTVAPVPNMESMQQLNRL